jgi:hypothetical protein
MSSKLAALAAVVAVAALAFAASASSAGAPNASQQVAPQTTGTATTTKVGNVNVRLQVRKFVRRAGHLYAVGTAISRFTPSAAKAADMPSATSRKAFTARVVKIRKFSSAQRICPVLDLTLGPVHFELLGLILDLNQVHLTLTADSNGGVLGSLLCGLSGHRLTPLTITREWTQAAQQSGLATKGVNFGVGLYQTTSSDGTTTLSTSPNALSPLAICTVLDLTVGPLHLDLLGLIVDLNRLHLTITADSNGGLLGSLLCSLAGRGGASAGLTSAKAVRTLNRAATKSGLATKGVRMVVPLFQTTSASGATTLGTTKSPLRICTVLELTLGPLDLNLLGLMVHLSGAAPTDPVHLLITADSNGGILGSLLCSLAGGGRASP